MNSAQQKRSRARRLAQNDVSFDRYDKYQQDGSLRLPNPDPTVPRLVSDQV